MTITVSCLGKEDTDEKMSDAVPERKDIFGSDTVGKVDTVADGGRTRWLNAGMARNDLFKDTLC